mmetsp:Transcript_3019/g.8276  ORF Transcript_3019/g.8276 Transcript_3019/m.8276 type:complete len:223 (-) Transcript_3019:2410-3078(-)
MRALGGAIAACSVFLVAVAVVLPLMSSLWLPLLLSLLSPFFFLLNERRINPLRPNLDFFLLLLLLCSVGSDPLEGVLGVVVAVAVNVDVFVTTLGAGATTVVAGDCAGFSVSTTDCDLDCGIAVAVAVATAAGVTRSTDDESISSRGEVDSVESAACCSSLSAEAASSNAMAKGWVVQSVSLSVMPFSPSPSPLPSSSSWSQSSWSSPPSSSTGMRDFSVLS